MNKTTDAKQKLECTLAKAHLQGLEYQRRVVKDGGSCNSAETCCMRISQARDVIKSKVKCGYRG